MQTIAAVPKQRSIGSVQFLPVNLFASVMGMSGLSLAWRQASKLYGISTVTADVIGIVAILMFLAVSAGYISKWVRYPHKVKAEFTHPILGNFFGTITIAILLLSTVIGFRSQATGQVIWIIGTVLTLAFSCIMLGRLLNGNHDHVNVVPPWLIPGVGTLDIAVAGGTMPFPWAQEINLMSLAIGGIIALVFLTMILTRLIHHDPLPAGLTPSMMIMIAPFEVGFLGYANFEHRIDPFASILFYFGLFLFVVLFFKVFKKSIPFGASWWAVSFPLAALSNAALEYALYVDSWLLIAISTVILAFLSIVLLVLFVRTLTILFNGKLLQG
ncbi:SLAC1 anion channel family protein [Paenibacillus glycinis]|uniref:C4-dicarboxylate ABC transporter n=1 Tax=Paenibacillus glycinis TaxID=2697035 RepID=A0ABW9XQ90_9BACL|nr:SLAC1 anion channel family protein [Paenibacillus glycinis]NBD24804.1 C4-dicarboxylate ABC transporter [Paenibacillus glycinis]